MIVRILDTAGYRRHTVDVDPGPVGADIAADVMALLQQSFPWARIRYCLYAGRRCLELEW